MYLVDELDHEDSLNYSSYINQRYDLSEIRATSTEAVVMK